MTTSNLTNRFNDKVNELTDEQLVDNFKNGDESAFVAIMQRYKTRLTHLAWSVVHNEDDAMDIVQDAFIKIYKKLYSFRGTSKLYTWLYRIVMNHSIDYVRKRPGGIHIPISEMINDPKDTNKSNQPEDNLLDQELHNKIFEAIDKLPKKQKEVILLREVENLSYDDIADTLNCSVGTVMSRLYYARERLRKYLEPYVNDKNEN